MVFFVSMASLSKEFINHKYEHTLDIEIWADGIIMSICLSKGFTHLKEGADEETDI